MLSVGENSNHGSCHAILSFAGERLDPDDIASLIAARVTKARKKGDKLARPLAGHADPAAKVGYCEIATSGAILSNDINEHIAYLLSQVEDNLGSIQSFVDRNNIAWRIVCFFEDENIADTWDLSHENANRAITIGIPIYSENVEKLAAKPGLA